MKLVAGAMASFALAAALVCVNSSSQSHAHQSPSQNPAASELAEEVRLSHSVFELFKQKKFSEALLVGKQLLALRQKMFGPEDSAVASSLVDLAEIHLASKEDREAEALYKKAVAILEKQSAANTLLLSNAFEKLGYISSTKRDYKKAAGFLEQALAIREKSVAKGDLSLARLVHSLANLYQIQRRFDEAEPLYVRSLPVMEQTLGRENPETVTSMKDFACLRHRDLQAWANQQKADETQAQKDPNRELRLRAQCWLYGFKQDCASISAAGSLDPSRILNGKALSLPKPEYPISAREARAQGLVLVAVLINEHGNVTQARVICGGQPTLHEPALTSARRAKFSPTLKDGKPVEVTGVITYNFVAQ